MRVFQCPAAYARHIETAIALAVAETHRDKQRREDDDAVVRSLASLPDCFVDESEKGTLLIMVGVPNAGVTDDLPTHLQAFTAVLH